jgi:hypothetical protein
MKSTTLLVSLLGLSVLIASEIEAQPTDGSLAKLRATCSAHQEGIPGVYMTAIVSALSQQNVNEAIRVYNQARALDLTSGQIECMQSASAVIKAQQAAHRQREEEQRAALQQRAAAEQQARQEQRKAQNPLGECKLLVLQLGERMALQAAPQCKELLQEETANTPPTKHLEELYGMYLMAKDCYEIRKEFEVPYLTERQFQIVRTVTRKKEQELVKQFPALAKEKDGVWDTTTRQYGKDGPTFPTSKYNKDAHDLCRRVVSAFMADAQRNEKPKRDF